MSVERKVELFLCNNYNGVDSLKKYIVSLKKRSKSKQPNLFGDYLCLILLSFTTRLGNNTEAAVTVGTRGGNEEMLSLCGHFL